MGTIKRGLVGIISAGLCMLSMSGAASEKLLEGLPPMDCVINPSEVVDLGTAVEGKVVRITVDRSDRVSADQVLVELESTVEKAALILARHRAGLNTSITLRQEVAAFNALNRQRNDELLQTQAISQHDADRIRSEARTTALQVQQERDNKKLAQLEQQRAEAVLALRTIRSPIDGVVMERFKSVGEFVDDQPLLRIARLDPLHVEVIVPVEHMGRIYPGLQAQVQSVIAGSEPFTATVERVDPIADAASGTFGVRLSVRNSDYQIAAGLRCQLTFIPGVVEPEVTVLEAPLADNGVVYCLKAGPFVDKDQALQWGDTLQTDGVSYTLEQTLVKSQSSFIVLSMPDAKDQNALQQRLRQLGVDNFAPMLRGAYRDRISFGVYNGRRSAERRQQALSRLGIATEILTRDKQTETYWLMLMSSSGPQSVEQLSHELSAKHAGLQVLPEQCSPSVAARQVAG